MDTSLFDYPLPAERIAQTPVEPRDSARLLVVNRATRQVEHRVFRELPELLPPGTRLFRNHASVFKARLRLTRPTGGQLECLLLHPDLARDPAANTWWCLLKPGKKYAMGAKFGAPGLFEATVLEKERDGRVLAKFDAVDGVLAVTEKIGEMPLPPYIHRAHAVGSSHSPNGGHKRAQQDCAPTTIHDDQNYQTVYADPAKKIAAAAPTAGLHFTSAVLDALASKGFKNYDLALRVGLGTFRPIAVEKLEDHVIHREWYEIPADTRQALAERGGSRLAIGTTTLRALEDYFLKKRTTDTNSGRLGEASLPQGTLPEDPWLAEADIFIYPPRHFAGVDLLLTNFHLPRSTLLCLVSAFLAPGSTDGIAWLKEIYAEAMAHEYRFYSYGDAMLIL